MTRQELINQSTAFATEAEAITAGKAAQPNRDWIITLFEHGGAFYVRLHEYCHKTATAPIKRWL